MVEQHDALGDVLSKLAPRLYSEPVVFATVAVGYESKSTLATVREAEGLTVVMPQSAADDDGLIYDFIGAWITLQSGSDLHAVGLTAAISGALARADIACNTVAGFHHDHIVVPWEQRHDAVVVLDTLG